MEIEYKSYFGTNIESISYWISSTINDRMETEDKLDKVINLISLIGEKLLIENPEMVTEVADIIGCAGFHHRIKENE